MHLFSTCILSARGDSSRCTVATATRFNLTRSSVKFWMFVLCFLQARNPKFILIVKVYMVGIAPIIRFSCFGSSMKYDDGSRQAGPNAAR